MKRLNLLIALQLMLLHAAAEPGSNQYLEDISKISAGGNTTCALSSNGSIYCWGFKASSPSGPSENLTRPTPVFGLDQPATSIAVGRAHACALLADESVRCWGSNSRGQLGDGTTENHARPIPPSGLPSEIDSIAAGGFNSCASGNANTFQQVWCWGRGTNGAVGHGSESDQLAPISILTGALDITVGGGMTLATMPDTYSGHVCSELSDGRTACWGRSDDGIFGDDNENSPYVLEPVVVNVPESGGEGSWSAVVTGESITCMNVLEGAQFILKCSGRLVSGIASTPIDIEGFDDHATLLAIGQAHVCASSPGINISCWGQNPFGQLGNGTTNDSSEAVIPTGIDDPIIDLGMGEHHSCAVLDTGRVMCWGRNNSGQLGNDSLDDSHIPVLALTPDLLFYDRFHSIE